MAEQNTQTMQKNRKKYDYMLLLLTVFLVCFGVVMTYSASYYNAVKQNGNGYIFAIKQAALGAAGILLMLLISKIDYHYYVEFKLPTRGDKVRKINLLYVLYLLCIFLQSYVLGFDARLGAKRWIEVGGISFQPSEVTKICVIVCTAYVVNQSYHYLKKFSGFLSIFLRVAPLIILVLIENLSTAIVMSGIVVAICFVASEKKAYFIVVGLILVGIVLIIIFGFEDFRGARWDAWLNVETHDTAYQTRQGLYAIASGGLLGKGLGNSIQKLGYIPEAHNDMIFSVICEELGLVGAIGVIVVFIMILWRMLAIAVNAEDLFGSLLVVGVMGHIAIQVLINIAVVTNTIPATGIPLPFISYGGTALIMILAEVGMVLSVSNRIRY